LDYFIALIVLFLLMGWYGFIPSLLIPILPVIILGTMLFATGLGCFLSSVYVKYRDVQFALPFFIQLAMFASPVIYPVSIIQEHLQWLLYMNPMTGFLDADRACTLGHVVFDWAGLFVAFGISIMVFIVGAIYLKKTEYYFADLI